MIRLIQGDCLKIIRDMPDNSIDSLVTDPPAGIAFMGKGLGQMAIREGVWFYRCGKG